MVEMSMIAGAVTSLNAAHNIGKALLGLRDANLVREKVIELNGVIISAQNSAFAAQNEQFALLERVRELEKEIAKMKAWETEKEKYELAEHVPGNFTRALKNK